MATYTFSPSLLSFYPNELRAEYEAAGTWPSDGVSITEDTFRTYREPPPDGFVLGIDGYNQPAWVTAPPAPPPTRAQLAQAALDAGMQLESASHPEANAVYALDDVTQRQLQGLALAANGGLGFPNGQSTFDYPDKAGNPVTLDQTTVVIVYRAMASYVYTISQYAADVAADLPPNPYPVG